MDEFTEHRSAKLEEIIESMKGPVASGNDVIIDGRAVPFLTMGDNGNPHIGLILDRRLLYPIRREDFPQIARLVADAIAIGAGYASIAFCEKPKPFAPRCTLLEGIDEQ